MAKHIGEDNKISRYHLFNRVYELDASSVNPLQEWLMWEMIRKSMYRMRKNTKCFIVSKLVPKSKYSTEEYGVWHFWVAKDMSDYYT